MQRQKIESFIEGAIDALQHKSLKDAENWLDQSLSVDFDAQVPRDLLIAIRYWHQRITEFGRHYSPLEKADALMGGWTLFLEYAKKLKSLGEKELFALRTCIFGMAMEFLYEYNNAEGINNPSILWRLGLCLKMAGEFQKAVKFLERALSIEANNSASLAELADVYLLLDNEETGKLLFREACLHHPELMRVETFESAFLIRLLEETRAQGFSELSILYWLPIVAMLKGVLTSKRILKPTEVGQLKQAIYQTEREYQETPEKREILTPQLLYKYFWLLDHVRAIQSPPHVVNEILLKIETLHPKVYKLYTQ